MGVYFKVIVLHIDTFESHITDERHFSNRVDADAYLESISSPYVGIILEM